MSIDASTAAGGAATVGAGAASSPARRRLTLSQQFLGLQILIVLAVMIGVLLISLAQSTRTFERVEGRRALSAAETLAAMPVVRALLPEARPRFGAALPAAAESVRTVSGSALSILATEDGRIIASSDPTQLGEQLELAESRVLEGRSWTGEVQAGGVRALVAQVPVLDDAGKLVGVAVVGRDYPSVWQRLGDATPNLLTYLGISLALGTAGSLLLSRRVKRQTLGMEPDEIAGLVEHREAIVHGVKEGVVAIDLRERVTLANDSARTLLGWPDDCEGRTLQELRIEPALREVLTQKQPDADRLVLVGDRLVVLNRKPMRSRGKLLGAVTTLRDRTELSSLEKELSATRTTTDTLRAQTHEFANQLHTISGLIQLGEYDEVLNFVDGVSFSRTRLLEDVTSRIQDAAVAALLIAKSSLATERGVGITLDPASRLERVDDELSRDLTTVVGNLVDNAIDAVSGLPEATVVVSIDDDGGVDDVGRHSGHNHAGDDEVDDGDRGETGTRCDGGITVTVRDSGPGVAPGEVARIFRQGFSTKASVSAAGRGFGLALTRLVCMRRGGDVVVHNDSGAVFTARLGKRSRQ